MEGVRGAIVALACAFATGAAAGDLRFVMVMHGQPPVPFWQVVRNGADAAAGELGVTVEFQATATYHMVQMAALIEAAVASELLADRDAGQVCPVWGAADRRRQDGTHLRHRGRCRARERAERQELALTGSD